MKILVVCTGNICRSPMAEGILVKLVADAGVEGIEVRSAGTLGIVDCPPDAYAVAACAERDTDISRLSSAAVEPGILEWADIVLGMEDHHLDMCRSLPLDEQPRFELLGSWTRPDTPGIADPVGEDLDAFRDCRDVIFECAKEFVRCEFQPDAGPA